MGATGAVATTTAMDRVLGCLSHVRRSGDGWQARCPAHDDRTPSLHVSPGADGRVLVKCHAGCSVSAILTALGLQLADLFDTPAPAALQERARYEYRDERGAHLLDVVRFAPKTFRQQRPDGTWTAKGVRDTVYRLERLHTDRPSEVAIVEGEKDADRLWTLGIPATTNRGGAGRWTDDLSRQLHAAGVTRAFVIPDNDDAGRAHAEAVAGSCQRAGVAAVIVPLPGVPDKGDITDYLGTHTADDLRQLMTTPAVTPVALPPSRLTLTAASTFTPRAVRWLWEDRLPCGTLSLLAGREAQGKSSLAAWITARVSTGTLPGALYGEPTAVVIVAAEDSWAHTIRPRLEAAGADLDRVFQLTVQGAGLSLPDDLEALSAVLAAQRVGLLVLDPLMSRLDTKIDTHIDADVRTALEPLAVVADLTGTAVLGLIHTNKSTTSDATNAVMGSRAFTAVARSVLFAAPDAEDETRRVLGVVKSNLGRLDVPTLAYRIETACTGHDDDGRPITTGRVVMLGESTTTVGDALRATLGTTTRTVVGDAAAWLQERLADGPVSRATLITEGQGCGYGVNAIKRASKSIGVVITSSNTVPRTTTWALPVGSRPVGSLPPVSPIEPTEPTEPTGDF